ncbi:hypothetical protein M0R19_04930 [Candidatus Pacearchaeota archaeon]|jgi:hypothetical protein|nr:hypothetical protein [Candidatus Pacearchaeota archaeon]
MNFYQKLDQVIEDNTKHYCILCKEINYQKNMHYEKRLKISNIGRGIHNLYLDDIEGWICNIHPNSFFIIEKD